MAHPVGGPLRGLAICLREELNLQKDPAFQMARRVLKGMNGRGFVVRRGDGAETRSDSAELDEILRWLERQPPALVAPAAAEVAHAETSPTPEAAAVPPAEPPNKGKRKRVKASESALPLFADLSVEATAPTAPVSPPEPAPPAPLIAPEPPAPAAPAFDPTPLLQLALDAHDALQVHRPDLAQEAILLIIELLSAHAK